MAEACEAVTSLHYDGAHSQAYAACDALTRYVQRAATHWVRSTARMALRSTEITLVLGIIKVSVCACAACMHACMHAFLHAPCT